MSNSNKEACKICGSGVWTQLYTGPIRQGKFGRAVPGIVWRCEQCGTGYLPPLARDLEQYYQSDAYRTDVGETADVASFFALHDAEQFPKYGLLAGLAPRSKVIADVGCAAGSFLDGLRGFAAETIGIEPATFYHDSLRQRHHLVYPSTSDALHDWQGRVDLVTCFSVIEHVVDPVGLLRELRALLAEGGQALISTPNARDILLQLGGDSYRSFFYRTVHLYYFDEDALRAAAQAAGFAHGEARYVHRFNFANFAGWLREQKPTGNEGSTPLGAAFDQLWRGALEANGAADYLYMFVRG